jgi:hypothetical protein
MTEPLRVDDYVEFLGKEYLLDYIRTGGAAVKFCVGPPGALATFRASLRSTAEDNNYHHAGIDAADTKMSMTDQVLFALTRTLDLVDVARTLTTTAYRAAGFPPQDGTDLGVYPIAEHYQVDPGELYRSVRRRLEQTLLGDRLLPRDLRLALLRLGQHQLGSGDVSAAETEAIESWLTGRPGRTGVLRSAGIRYRITRSSAHRLLLAVPGVVAASGHRGLIVDVRLDRLGIDRPKTNRDGLYYTKGARLDVYEVLRRLVDATDALSHCLLVVSVPDSLFDDPERGPFVYHALAMRLVDDVTDRHLSNPFASVVRVA